MKNLRIPRSAIVLVAIGVLGGLTLRYPEMAQVTGTALAGAIGGYFGAETPSDEQ